MPAQPGRVNTTSSTRVQFTGFIISLLYFKVGFHTTLSFQCKCPATKQYAWMCGPKACSFHANWRLPAYWDIEDALDAGYRFNPPSYYKHLACSREGTLEVAYIGMDDRDQLFSGFVKPFRRKAEYCVCKPRYHGAKCDKVSLACFHSY